MTIEMPKRLSPPARPGELLKRFDAVARVKRASNDDPDYLAMIRQLPCLYCGMEPSEAAHVRYASAAFGKASGLGKKPDDRFCVPLCAECHRLGRYAQHNRGEESFWIGIGINPLLVAQNLHDARGDIVRMRAVVMVAIANRQKEN